MSKETADFSDLRLEPAVEAARRDLPAVPPAVSSMRLAEIARRLVDGANDDLEGGAGPPLLAAVFAGGVSAWFSLPHEPWPPALYAAALAALAFAIVRRRRGARALVAIVVATVLLGAAVAALGAHLVAAPRLDRERTVAVEGRVNDLDATAKGGVRMGVAVARMEGKGLPAEAIPTQIAATLPAGRSAPAVGDAIAFKARLKPPEGPVLPDGYDFARRAWFDGRGASGYVLGRAHPIDLGPPSLLDRALAPVGALRHAVADRVRAALPGGTGAIGAALMVGEQRAIPEATAEPLRASGLTHIVSISGLHMSLVAGGVMAALRLLFVAIPGFGLHRSAKKWVAVAALLAATIYLLLSGLQVAAVRSHLMLSVALIAVLVDRPAITMHTVAVAAMAILLVDPEAAMEPSFRMSFLAVIALVASWDLWQLRVAARPPPRKDEGPLAHGLVAAWRHAEGLAFSSLVAGLATAPVIVGVFYRGAPYSILANMIVLPVVGLLVMPAAVVAALAMPFGLDDLPLAAMGLGIDFMVAVGRWTSALPGGAGLVGAPHPLAMPFGVVAVLWLSLWRSRIRLFGLVPAVLSIVLAVLGPRPDVLVGRHGSPVAVRGDDGRLHVLADRNDRFDVAIWLAADADGRSPTDAGLASGWRCDRLGCAYRRDGDERRGIAPLAVAVVRDLAGFAEDCATADVIVSRLAAPPACAETATVVDRPRQAATGATALTIRAPVAPPSESAAAGAEAAVERLRPGPRFDPVDPTRDDEPAGVEPRGADGSDAAVAIFQPRAAGSSSASSAGGGEVAGSASRPRIAASASGRTALGSSNGDPGDVGRSSSPNTFSAAPSADVRSVAPGDPAVARAAPNPPPPILPRVRRLDFIETASLPPGRRSWSPADPLAAKLAAEAGPVVLDPVDPAEPDASDGADDPAEPGPPVAPPNRAGSVRRPALLDVGSGASAR
ncbi:MAG: ComEC family competence protein [Hyphomicrobiales bacterium]|nr:ComEC family competence protein [Hyphomicrobiales bacterium]